MNWSITDASGVICKRAAQSGDAYQKGRASKETLKQRGRGRALREAGWSPVFLQCLFVQVNQMTADQMARAVTWVSSIIPQR